MKMKRRDSRRERKLATGLVVATVLIVALATGLTFYFSPENQATRELERMATEYYETYLYGSSVSTFENGVEGIAEMSKKGIQPVKLRQLLLYNGGKNKDLQKLFESSSYRCDLDATQVVYHPVEPYGVKDYTIEYKKECKKASF